MFEGVVDVDSLVEAHAGESEDFECFKGLLYLYLVAINIIVIVIFIIVLVRWWWLDDGLLLLICWFEIVVGGSGWLFNKGELNRVDIVRWWLCW